jgi:hypothetical protein
VQGVDAVPEAAPMDVRADAPVDAPTDVVDVATMDSGACVETECDNQCVLSGCIAGVCRTGACSCVACPDVTGRDVMDVTYESSVVGCTANSDCPPSEFCSGTSCTGVGFCYPRGEADAATCDPDPHPSCGCDGVAYPSVCARLSAGVRANPSGCSADASVDAAHPGG